MSSCCQLEPSYSRTPPSSVPATTNSPVVPGVPGVGIAVGAGVVGAGTVGEALGGVKSMICGL